MQLFLNKAGIRLGVRDGRYHIRHADGEESVPPGQVSSICLNRAASLSYEAVMLAVEHETEILFIDGKGFPFARLWSPRYGSISTIRKNQVRFAQSPAAVEWIRQILLRKTENQTVLLSLLRSLDPAVTLQVTDALTRLERYRARILEIQGEDIAQAGASFRGLEGKCGFVYFRAISDCLPDQYRFEKRSKHPALDMFNSLLNYAYGMLYGRVEHALIRAGIDPYLGILHRDEYNRPVLVYDVIEPYRIWAEYVVVKLCMDQAIFIEFFEISQGAFWLADIGKRILIQSLNDYLDEVVEIKGQRRSRQTHIDLEAQQLAAMFKSFDPGSPEPDAAGEPDPDV
ncbi:MAG: CRISPR-associated endonuclease Cas1 [Bacteroidia bacterium]|nr:CRISPR-associated endonuclease Cas1 [Bacteroidia bacterium]